MKRRAWTEDELAVLRAHYARMAPKALAALLGRSLPVLYAKAQDIGLSRPPRPDLWADGDDALLRERFSSTPATVLAAEMGRTEAAVRHRAARLGLRKPEEYFAGDAFDAVRGRRKVMTESQVLDFLRTHVRIDEDGCRIWAASYTRTVPTLMWAGKRRNARRLLVELSGRHLRPSLVVYASCGKTLCMHEDHLRVGTRTGALQTKSKAGLLHGGTSHSLAVARSRAHDSRMPITERFNVARMRAEGWTWKRIGDHYGTHLSAPQKQMRTWERIFGPAAYWVEPMRDAA